MNLLKSNFSGRNSVELVYLIYYFSLGCNFSMIKKLTRCTNYNMKIFQNAILEVINSYVEENKEMIGGKDMIVEVDESFVGKRKYNIGRTGNQKIILGGVCRSTKKFFMKIITNRNKKTIEEEILKHIHPQTTIYTDQWSSYIYFFKENNTFNHQYVNHKLHFVDPITKTHTQNVESLWASFKKFKRSKQYFKQEKLDLYISEYFIRKKFEGDDFLLFLFLIKLIFK
ncbi:hypothetical protein H312_01792 [Anncaliia algerae PRA339]|uniref:ISXO2-like transposase domain-containing protein n=1 Tax=Anncaliia algerae PRA339 TaxID=1288291 RepID=A0A059F0T2_9MICR|nr:hypothetical protein H312_01792 [Anncaliia algerae PRA339]